MKFGGFIQFLTLISKFNIRIHGKIKNVKYFQVILLFNSLSNLTGEEIDIENFWRIPDTLRCENHHFPQLLANLTPWFSQNLMEKLEELNTKINKFTSGIYSNPSYEIGEKSIDISKEIAKLKSGPLITEVYQRMIRKLENGMEELKYYAYSSVSVFFSYQSINPYHFPARHDSLRLPHSHGSPEYHVFWNWGLAILCLCSLHWTLH